MWAVSIIQPPYRVESTATAVPCFGAIAVARLLTHRAAAEDGAGEAAPAHAAMARLHAAETAYMVTLEAMRIHGGYGYIKEYPVERFFRDAKITQIYEGTSQIQRLVIARALLETAVKP